MNLLKEGSKNHEKAKGKVDVQCLHVGYLWQSPKETCIDYIIDFYKTALVKLPVDSPHECDHGEDGGDTKSHPCRGRATIQVETHLHVP